MADPDTSRGQAPEHVGKGRSKACRFGDFGAPLSPTGVHSEDASPPREDFAGAIWHLTARGVRKERIFLDARDYAFFLRVLEEVVERFGWVVRAYCLMPNHYHLLVETPRATLSDGMEHLNGRHAQYFNLRHGVEGHVFERRFRSVPVRGEAQLLELLRYIVLNPVRADLCATPLGWRWSSYPAAMGEVRRPKFLALDWLVDLFDGDLRAAREGYERFVHAVLVPATPARADPWDVPDMSWGLAPVHVPKRHGAPHP
jgi:putative transposase